MNAPGRPRQPPRNTTDAPAEADDLAGRVGYPPEGSAIADAFSSFETLPEEWRKPQPKCIRRLPPYEF